LDGEWVTHCEFTNAKWRNLIYSRKSTMIALSLITEHIARQTKGDAAYRAIGSCLGRFDRVYRLRNESIVSTSMPASALSVWEDGQDVVYLLVSRTRAAIRAWVDLEDKSHENYAYWMKNLQREIVSELYHGE